MNAHIEAIVIFSSNGEKRYVPFQSGLNIITGESKSGKSALLEIIDYCFGSAKSTIPKGEVTNFTFLYSIIIKFETYSLVIGRKSFEENGSNRMYIFRNRKKSNVESLTLKDFNEQVALNLKQAKQEIGSDFGLNITDIKENSESMRKDPSPTIRNMVSYFLQHQNLVASKFALFYRFEDSKKREQVIGQFPVFSGWVDQNYYNLKIELDTLLKEKRRNERSLLNYNNSIEVLRKELQKTFNLYFYLVGDKLKKEYSIDELLQLRNRLPEFSRENYFSEEIETRYFELKNDLEEHRQHRSEIEIAIKNLEISQGYGISYSKNLKALSNKGVHSISELEKYDCPLCGNEVKQIQEEINSITQSKQWLENELASVGIKRTEFGEQIKNLMQKKNIIGNRIKELNNEIIEIEELFQKLNENKKYEQEVIYAKANIDIQCKLIEKQLEGYSGSIDDIDQEIDVLRTRISNYNLDSYFARTKGFFDKNISRIIEKLDFEEEFRPANMNFNLDTFDLYHYDKKSKSKVYLSEMGSGANWLACHLSLFLTFLHFFSTQKDSVIPSILFIDQPSQVYFPENVYVSGDDKPNDIKRVEEIYITILEEIDLIQKKAGYTPQVIVTDHVGELDLGRYNFQNYVRRNWRGTKFI